MWQKQAVPTELCSSCRLRRKRKHHQCVKPLGLEWQVVAQLIADPNLRGVEVEPAALADAMSILSKIVEVPVVYKDPYWQQCREGIEGGQH